MIMAAPPHHRHSLIHHLHDTAGCQTGSENYASEPSQTAQPILANHLRDL